MPFEAPYNITFCNNELLEQFLITFPLQVNGIQLILHSGDVILTKASGWKLPQHVTPGDIIYRAKGSRYGVTTIASNNV